MLRILRFFFLHLAFFFLRISSEGLVMARCGICLGVRICIYGVDLLFILASSIGPLFLVGHCEVYKQIHALDESWLSDDDALLGR